MNRRLRWNCRPHHLCWKSPSDAGAGHDSEGRGQPNIDDERIAGILAGDLGQTMPELVFVGWELSGLNLTVPDGLVAHRSSFSLVQRHVGIDAPVTTWFWQPTHQELERIRFCVRFGDASFVREAMFDSLDDSCFDLLDAARAKNHPICYSAQAELSRALAEIPAGRIDHQEEARARQRFQAALERELVLPLLERGRASHDPCRRVLYEMAAHQTAMVARSSVEADAGMSAIMAGRVTGPHYANALSLIESYERRSKSLLAIFRELRR